MIRFRYLFITTIILVGGSIFFTTKKRPEVVFFAHQTQRHSPMDRTTRLNHVATAVHQTLDDSITSAANSEELFTINTEGCSIPALKPLDESVTKFVTYPSDFPRCPIVNNPLLGNNRQKIWVRYDTFKYYGINKTDKLTCCYRSLYRPAAVDDIESKRIDDRFKYSFCTYFDDVIEAKHEFVRVTCYVRKATIYEQFFLFARNKINSYHGYKKEIMANHNKTMYNVLILGLDAVSRLNFHRTMPKTAIYLRQKGAVEFMGYNKVADNTFPNIVPMLMGLKASELKKTCLPYGTATFNNCPLIWKWFKKAGYFTALGEDAPNLAVFNYLKTGFNIAPTDYYLRTFMNEAIKYVGSRRVFYSYLCIHDKYIYKMMLNYIEELTWRLTNKKLFGFFWEISMSHDKLNFPMKMDDDYLKLLSKWELSRYLSKTIVIFVSDHGIRWGKIRYTKQGRLEERLPLLYILPPPSFRNNYNKAYSNLKVNSKRLTSPFDVYATLYDLTDLKNIENDMIVERSSGSFAEYRAISLFLPIPSSRTCEMADIDDHWCTCHKEVALKKDNPQAFEAAKMLILLINGMLKDYPQCAKLAVSDMVDAMEIKAGEAEVSESTWKEFRVVVKTAPGGGIFEATLRQDGDNQSWKLLGTPSRLNLYSNQSRCVNHYQMKLYCYCE